MSQAGIISTTSGPVPPTVPTTFVTDVNSPAVPAANILNVLGNDTTANDDDGIRTDGSSGSNTLTVQLTNRLQGSVTTTNSTPTPVITFAPTVVGTYAIEARIAAFNTTSTLGAAYSVFGAARYDGVTYNLVGTMDRITNEEGAMSSANVTITVSGAGIFFNAVGYGAENIKWSGVGLYTFVGP